MELLEFDVFEEAVRLDPLFPASLSISAPGRRDGLPGDPLMVCLTFTDGWRDARFARGFLTSLKDLLEKPLAVLA